MSNLKHLTAEQLRIERERTVKRIDDLELKISIGNSPTYIKRYKSTISGQRERLRWIDSYIKQRKEST